MFRLELRSGRWPVYALMDEAANAILEVVPERGGLVSAWSVGDHDLLYLDRPRFADPSLSVRGGIPLLFPICGNLPDNRYQLPSGEGGSLKQHGFARDLPWAVLGSSTEGAAELTLGLASSPETLAVYPFEFRLSLTYRLVANRLEIHWRCENTGDRPLPFSAGLHPYFAAPDKSALGLSLPAREYRDQKTGLSGTVGEPVAIDWAAPELDWIFGALEGNQAQVVDRSRGLSLKLEWEEPYRKLVFWTLVDRPFYCLEPWTAGRNALNTGEDLVWVEPGDRRDLVFRLSVES